MLRFALPPTRARGISLLALSALFVACEAPNTTAPSPDELILPGLGSKPETPELIVCPSDETRSVSAVLTPLGGVLSLGEHLLVVPQGALQLPVLVTMTEPASQYMEISVEVDGFQHFEFLRPVTIALSYQRCDRSAYSWEPLQAWYIDQVTKELLENMGGIDLRWLELVLFRTGHLSG
jgi:hypothetical protein